MSDEVVLNRFNKLAKLTNKTLAIIVMWDELTQTIKDGINTMALFWAFKEAVPGLRLSISQEIIKRENICFEDLRMMHLNSSQDEWFKSEIQKRMELSASKFEEYRELYRNGSKQLSLKIFGAASKMDQLLYILEQVEDQAEAAMDKIVTRIKSGDIEPEEVADICKYAFSENDPRKMRLMELVKEIIWPFDKWKECLCEIFSFESEIAAFFLRKMYGKAESFEEYWTVHEFYANFSIRDPRSEEIIVLLASKARTPAQLKKLFGEVLSFEGQQRIVDEILRNKPEFSFEELVSLRALCHRKDNRFLENLLEGMMGEKASSFKDWKAIFEESRSIAKPYIIQMLSQVAESAEDWEYVYKLSRRYDYDAMVNKAFSELKKISALT